MPLNLSHYIMMNIYEQPHTIACFETDERKNLRAKAFMDWAQEIAQLHAEQLHFGYDDFIGRNLAWVVTRFYAKFVNPPRWKDKVVVRTWHRGLQRVMSVRDFQVLDSNGGVAVAATSSWVILDLATRQFSRAHFGIDSQDSICTDQAVGHSAEKVAMPKGAVPEHVSDHIVSYSDTDMNGHTNNASYIGWAMDAVGYEVTRDMDLDDFTVNFNHESKAGECVSIWRHAVPGGKEYYIEGRSDERSVFSALLRFK